MSKEVGKTTATKSTPVKGKTSNKMDVMGVELASFEDLDYDDCKDKNKPYILFGKGHEIPGYLLELYNESAINGSLINGISEMIAGKGFVPDPASPNPDPAQVLLLQNWQKQQYGRTSGIDILTMCALNLKLHGSYFLQVQFSAVIDKKRSIAKMTVLPNQFCAPGTADDTGVVKTIYFSKNWERPQGKYKPKPIPAFDPANPEPVQILWIKRPIADGSYFPKPDYFPSLRYIEIDREVATFHLNGVLNGLAPSHWINFASGQIDDEEKELQVKKKIKKEYGGSKGAKVIVSWSNGQEEKPEITTMSSSDLDKQYEFISTFSSNNVMRGHRVTSPMLFGVRDGGNGLGNNADELHVGMKLFDRNVVKKFQEILIVGMTPILQLMGIQFPVIIEGHDMEDLKTGDRKEVTKPGTEARKLNNQNSAVILTGEQTEQVVAHLEAAGHPLEFFTNQGYQLVHSEYVDLDDVNRPPADYVMLAIQSEPDLPSALDRKKGKDGYWLVRYAYDGPFDDRNRDYCHEVLSLKLIYRKEDIDQMSFRSENKEFGTYSIWRFKGSYGCRHRWKRLLFFQEAETGDINRVGNVPSVVNTLPDEEATQVNVKPRRKVKNKHIARLLKMFEK